MGSEGYFGNIEIVVTVATAAPQELVATVATSAPQELLATSASAEPPAHGETVGAAAPRGRGGGSRNHMAQTAPWRSCWTDASKSSAGSWDESIGVFLEGYGKILEEIRKEAGDNLRKVVEITPPPLENLGSPLPDHQENNRRLSKVRDALQTFAKERNADIVDLFRAMGVDKFEAAVSHKIYTHDGLHFTKYGCQ